MTMGSLLGSNDPAPYEVRNHSAECPLVIACDHAENRFPEGMDKLGVSAEYLGQHIAYDIGAKQVAISLSEKFNAPLILANYSRLLIDLNRHLDSDTLIVAQSDGIPIPGNQNISDEEKHRRISEIFYPYHDAYEQLVKRVSAQYEKPIILSVHSFTPTMNGFARPWDYGVLWEEAHESLAMKLFDGFSEYPNLNIGDNQPYHANYPRGYAQVHHAENRNIEMALIEIRQDRVASQVGQMRAADELYEVIEPLLNWQRA